MLIIFAIRSDGNSLINISKIPFDARYSIFN